MPLSTPNTNSKFFHHQQPYHVGQHLALYGCMYRSPASPGTVGCGKKKNRIKNFKSTIKIFLFRYRLILSHVLVVNNMNALDLHACHNHSDQYIVSPRSPAVHQFVQCKNKSKSKAPYGCRTLPHVAFFMGGGHACTPGCRQKSGNLDLWLHVFTYSYQTAALGYVVLCIAFGCAGFVLFCFYHS